MRYPLNLQRTPVTLVLLGLMISLEVFFQLEPSGEARYQFFNKYLGILPSIWSGQVWRPFTTCLMHGNLLHAAFNLWWFAIFSSVLEPFFGWKRYLGVLVLLGYVSILPEYVVHGYTAEEPAMIVGFSGILYGLFGILLVGRRYRPEFFDVCDHQTAQLLIAWFFICIVLTWANIMPVANVAHGAGWLFGWLYGMAIFQRKNRKVWIASAVLLTVVVLATLVICPGHYGFDIMKKYNELWWQS